jgi:hypothetical protein
MSDEAKDQRSDVKGQKHVQKNAGEVEAVRTPQVFAVACPKNPGHLATRVYKTKGEIRYCVCDDCGHTWKQTGPLASGAKKERQPTA